MSSTNFDGLKTLWVDAGVTDTTAGTSTLGDIYKTTLVDNGTIGTLVAEDKTDPVRGYAPFSRFMCEATDSPVAS